jgi:hypothetical protein
MARFALLAAVMATTHARADSHSFALRADPAFSAGAWTDNVLDAFRLGLLVKDREVEALERDAQRTHPIALGAARAAELVLIDIPIASYATVLPHEVFGHGARMRELGSGSTYHFRWPPPYGFTPSSTRPDDRSVLGQPDANLLYLQSGIRVETYEARQLMRSAFADGATTRFDTGMLVGIPIHEIVEATLPFGANDVRAWATLQAQRSAVPMRTIQRRYLYSSIFATLVDPVFVYSCYDSFWRFIALGHRGGALPSVELGGVDVLARPHVDPVPWGLEYELVVLGRSDGAMFEIGPRIGIDPAASWASAGLALAVRGLRLTPSWHVGGALDVWIQPHLTLTGPVIFGAPTPNDLRGGARLSLDVAWHRPDWFVGGRVVAKTDGLSDLYVYDAGLEAFALVGVKLAVR